MTLADQQFSGFASGKLGTVVVPEAFFSDLLPLIDDLAELKITVYAFWALQQREGEYRYLRLRDLKTDQRFLNGMGGDPDRALAHGLACAAARGTLLPVELPDGEWLYFMNTERGRRAVEALERGDWRPGDAERPIRLTETRPTIYALYEQNIGPLTPLVADTLRDAENTYPYGWLVEAVKIATEVNKRSWRYIEAILKRWQTDGKTESRSKSEPVDYYLRDEYFQRKRENGS